MIFRFLLCLLLFYSGATNADQSVGSLPNPLKIVVGDNTFPYVYTDDNGFEEGLVIDYWREIGRRQNVAVEFVMADWADTLSMLQRGEVHVHGAIAYNEERAKKFQLVGTGIEIYSNVFLQRDLPSLTNLTQLTPFVIGAVENSSQLEILKKLIPNPTIKTYATPIDVYDAALNGEISAFAGLDRLPAKYARYKELVNQFPLYKKIPLRNIDLSYAVNLNSSYMATLVKATEQIEQTFLDQLERKWLALNEDKDTLLLGLGINNPPYMHVSVDGEAKGLFVDLWHLWSEQTGVKITFVPDTSFNTLRNLQKGRIDAFIAFPDNEMLPSNVEHIYQLYGFHSQFFTLAGPGAKKLTSTSVLKVGLLENAAYEPELKLRYPQATFFRYRFIKDLLAATIDGELDGFYAATETVKTRLYQADESIALTTEDDTMVITPMFSLTQKGNSELAQLIRSGFSQLPLEQLVALEEKWLTNASFKYFANFKSKPPLTAQEASWLEQHASFRVGMLSNWAPMEFADGSGDAKGVTVDMLNLLQQRLPIKFDIQLFDDFDALLDALQNKTIDVVTNIADREERRSFARFTDEFWSVQWAAVSFVNRPNIVSTSQLNGAKVAVYKDYQLAKHLNEVYPNIEVVAVASFEAGLEMLADGAVDYVLESVEAATETLKQTPNSFFRVQIIDDLPSYPSLVGVRDDYVPLVSILNKGLRAIDKQQRQQLYQKWFSFQITQGLNKTQLNQLIWQIGGAVALLLAFVIIWNLSLRREVLLRRQAEEKMRFMATHDDLTKLPNRSLIKERTEQALLQHARHNEMLALMFVDLDGFKQVNDQYGHDIGDELLVNLANLIAGTVRKSDTAARFGGDEFVILLTGLLNRDDAALVAEKILHKLAQPVSLSVGDVQVSASIGIAMYPFDGTDSARLLKVADNLMYRIKQQGKNHYCFSKAVNS